MTFEDTRVGIDDERTPIGWLHEELPVFGAWFTDEWTDRKHSLQQDRAETQETLSSELDDIEIRHERVAGRIEQSMDGEAEIRPNEREEVSETIATVANALDTLDRELDHEYVRVHELISLREQMVEVGVQKRYVDARVAFDEALDDVYPKIEVLKADLQPYEDYDQYLLRETKSKLFGQLEYIENALVHIEWNVDFEVLHQEDRARFDGLERLLAGYRSHLEGYNDRFVESQRQRYADLFTDIGDGYDFSKQQVRAIVTNERYNQIIAAAGAGKTDVLTYRIAYLLRKGVDAEEIVALTYTNEAAKEMRTRLGDLNITATERIDRPGVTVVNYHSFGKQFVESAARYSLEAVDDEEIESFLKNKFETLTSREGEFRDHFYEFLVHYDDDHLDETSFESKEAYVQARRTQEHTSLRGESVNTRAEKVIADFLYRNQVRYKYRQPVTWMDQGRDERRYRPAFYLLEADIYIEHWELDEAGDPYDWVSLPDHQYRKRWEWVREQYECFDHTVVETYEYEFEADPTGDEFTLQLEERLAEHGVELDPLSYEEFVEEAYESMTSVENIIDNFVAFIENAKRFGIKADEIPARLTESNQRQYHFGQCGRILLDAYETYLGLHEKALDFADMIYNAAEVVETFPEDFQNRYEHVLVDEFQDTSHAVISLLQGFQGEGRDTKLFAVGDDWQSIYSFQGASVNHFLHFAEYFGEPAITRLTKNFRCPETVLNAGTALMEHQPQDRQIKKNPDACSGRDTSPTVHVLPGDGDAYINTLATRAVDLVEEYLDAGSNPGDVMVLSRNDKYSPHLNAVKDELKARKIPWQGKGDRNWYDPSGTQQMLDEERPNAVATFSIHQSKGRQAKHVVFLHAATGYGGIPSEDKTSELIKPVKDDGTVHLAEERRLFYVAITRCKNTLDVITQLGKVSPFLHEIEEYFDWDEPEGAPVYEASIGETFDIEGEVSEVLSPHKKQEQRGKIEIGKIELPFISWAADNPPTVSEGRRYQFENIKMSEFAGNRQLVITSRTLLHPVTSDGPVDAENQGVAGNTPRK